MMCRTLRNLAIAGLAACGFAMPAAAVNINFQIANGNELQIVASDLGSDIIAAWDFDIFFNPLLTVNTAFTDNNLGVSNLDTIFGFLPAAGFIDAFEVSFLSDIDLDTLQNNVSPLTLLTVRFDQPDITNGGFEFLWDRFNDVKCAANQVCYPAQLVPETGTALLLALGLLGLAVSRRRRTD